jgi:hypothetical protein
VEILITIKKAVEIFFAKKQWQYRHVLVTVWGREFGSVQSFQIALLIFFLFSYKALIV